MPFFRQLLHSGFVSSHFSRLSLQDWHPDRDLCLLLTWRGAFPTVDGVVDSVTSI
jgi:hypothetical protein